MSWSNAMAWCAAIDPGKLGAAKKILGVKTETAAVD
jgi:hypothetical protein